MDNIEDYKTISKRCPPDIIFDFICWYNFTGQYIPIDSYQDINTKLTCLYLIDRLYRYSSLSEERLWN